MNFTPLRERFVALLRFTERYTKTDMVYLARSGFWLTAGQLTSAVAAFFVAVTLANLLPKETYGTYKYILALAGILGAISMPGMNAALVRSVARGMDSSVFPALTSRLFWGVLSALGALTIAGYYAFNDNLLLATSCLIVAVFLPFYDSFTLASSYLQGKKEFGKDARYAIAVTILASLATIGTVFLTDNLFILLAVFFSSYTILRAFCYWHALRALPPSESRDPKMVQHARHLTFINAFGLIATHIDKVLLFTVLGPLEVALYSIATSIPDHTRNMVRNIAVVAAPKFAEADGQEIKQQMHALWGKMLRATGLLVLLALLYIPLAPLVYGFLFPSYLDAIPLSQVFMFSLLAGVGVLPSTLLQQQKQMRPLYMLTITNSIVQILALIVLVHSFGVWGAILGRLVGYAFNGINGFMILSRTYAR